MPPWYGSAPVEQSLCSNSCERCGAGYTDAISPSRSSDPSHGSAVIVIDQPRRPPVGRWPVGSRRGKSQLKSLSKPLTQVGVQTLRAAFHERTNEAVPGQAPSPGSGDVDIITSIHGIHRHLVDELPVVVVASQSSVRRALLEIRMVRCEVAVAGNTREDTLYDRYRTRPAMHCVLWQDSGGNACGPPFLSLSALSSCGAFNRLSERRAIWVGDIRDFPKPGPILLEQE